MSQKTLKLPSRSTPAIGSLAAVMVLLLVSPSARASTPIPSGHPGYWAQTICSEGDEIAPTDGFSEFSLGGFPIQTGDVADTEAHELLGLHLGTPRERTQLSRYLPGVDLLLLATRVARIRHEQDNRPKRPPGLRDGNRIRIPCRRPVLLLVVVHAANDCAWTEASPEQHKVV